MEKTIKDYWEAGYNMENLTCLNCGHTGEIVIDSKLADGYCQICGEWQEKYTTLEV